MPACDTLNVWFAIVRFADRAVVEVFAATVNPTDPFPFPLAPLVIVIHDAGLVAVHELLRTWSVSCESGGHLVLVHYRPVVPEHVLTGDDVHMIARDVLGEPLVALVDPTFRLDVFAR